ncbi:creatinine amidohydrolase [Bradyrhizobium macuxiense]|uniref:Creatinine amidohydrolase n=1 Tax=Bradyrhizobium macuxiense TaxID=1755647 RepID=A0A560KUE5_9BRAD|nr:creatininase family protein [Bradyrhizobium macuxiense]TWB86893.1 creatinine amidohydrolase [Bradyrhizobium macuxiense]
MNVARLTWPEFKAAISDKIVLIPVGATEPHGPHLPLSTDSIIAGDFCERIAKAIGGVTIPTIEYGYMTNPARLGGAFPGTIDIGLNTLRDLLYGILCSLYREGARRFVVFHAAYANLPICYDAIVSFDADCPGARVLAGSWWDFTSEKTRNDISAATGVVRADDNHAGLVETSLILYIQPGLVKTHLIGNVEAKFRERYTITPFPERYQTTDGTVYHAKGANRAIGERIYAEALRNVLSAIARELS